MKHLASRIPLPVALVVFATLWTYTPQEFVASDPWQYSLNAHRFTEGSFFSSPDNHPFHHRLGVTAPVALFYKLFGITILSTHLWSLCAALLVLCTIWWASSGGRAGALALLFGLCCVPLFKAATSLYPDLIVAAFLGLSSLLLYRRKRSLQGGGWSLLYPVGAVLFLFVAFLAKLSAWWVLPLWGVVFVQDVREGNRELLKRFYLPVLILAVALLVAYLFFCSVVWGDPFSRFHGVQNLAGQHLWSLQGTGTGSLIRRLTVDPIVLLGGCYNILPLFALLAWPSLPKELRFWSYYALCLVLCYWFGSASISAYEPLPVAGRMVLPALTGMAVTAGYFAAKFRIASVPMSKKARMLVANIVVLTLAVLPLLEHLFLQEGRSFPEADVVEILRREITAFPDAQVLLICADERSPESLLFYFGYCYPPNLRVISLASLPHHALDSCDKVYLFLHQERSEFLEQAYGCKNYTQEMLGLVGPEELVKHGPVMLWKYSEPEEISERVRS